MACGHSLHAGNLTLVGICIPREISHARGGTPCMPEKNACNGTLWPARHPTPCPPTRSCLSGANHGIDAEEGPAPAVSPGAIAVMPFASRRRAYADQPAQKCLAYSIPNTVHRFQEPLHCPLAYYRCPMAWAAYMHAGRAMGRIFSNQGGERLFGLTTVLGML